MNKIIEQFLLWNAYRSTSKYPAKGTKSDSFEEAQHIEQSKPFQQQAIAREVNRQGAIDGDAHYKQEKPHPVADPHAVVDERAVVVEVCDAPLADATVLGSE